MFIFISTGHVEPHPWLREVIDHIMCTMDLWRFVRNEHNTLFVNRLKPIMYFDRSAEKWLGDTRISTKEHDCHGNMDLLYV